ncbi:hypothetical protein AB0B25_16945 [Nocardia sp. NPDC049190]|uniref:hypothetical protein n=1 Tax=Nocardia sp. NPDC049190 TaxID=3155650 RepID=UPI0033F75634
MTFLAALLVAASSGYLIYRFAPRRAERAFRLERFHPRALASDRPLSHYDYQRRYSDLAAIYGRNDVPDRGLPDTEEAVRPISGSGPVARSRKPGSPASVQCGGSTHKTTRSPVIVPADPAAEPLSIGDFSDANQASVG